MSNPMRDWLDKYSDENVMGDDSNGLLVMDGYDDCIVGVVHRFNDTFVLYDRQRVLQRLMAEGMSYAEALEFHEFNQVGGWVGPHTVGFLETPELEELEEPQDGTDAPE